MTTANVPYDLPEAELQAAFANIREKLGDDPRWNKLTGHERICDCADCAEVRDAALRQFSQLMEHQCLYYVIQVTAAMDALCKTAMLRLGSASPDVRAVDMVLPVMERQAIVSDMSNYMAHPDTMEVTWRAVQNTITKRIAKNKGT